MNGTSLLSTLGQFGPVLLSYVSKNDDKELCFLKKFGFRPNLIRRLCNACFRSINVFKVGLTQSTLPKYDMYVSGM